MLCAEYYGSKTYNSPVVYRHDAGSGRMLPAKSLSARKDKWDFIGGVKAVFLPKGYPDSVSDDYLRYQIWDTVQAFCSSITGTLATHAVLKGAGVGDEAANAASATITWILKDGIGMVSRIAFAYFKGSSLDHEAKQWRLFADVLNDVAICTQLLSPMLPKKYFTTVMCAAGVAFSLVGVAGGCTRAALTMHQARRDNMADVSAKDGSQETLVNLAGLIISLLITPLVAGNLSLTWLLFFLFALIHIYANYKAVCAVIMETVNRARLYILVKHFYETSYIFNPSEANNKEPFITGTSACNVKVGCSLAEAGITTDLFLNKVRGNSDLAYIMKFNPTGTSYIALRDTATVKDIISALCNVEFLHLTSKSNGNISTEQIQSTLVPNFMSSLKSRGWDLNRHHLHVDEWRWTTNHLDKIKLT